MWRKKLFQYPLLYKQDIYTAFFACVSLIPIAILSTYFYFAKDLTSKDIIMNRNNTGVILMDRNGMVFYRFKDATYRPYVTIDHIPKSLQYAVISAEDKDFYHHPGFSVKAIGGALIADMRNRDFSYGGSTITQQLVKNSFLTQKKHLFRKFQEVVLANELERRFRKDEILEMYLNSAYFGQGAFGVEAASQIYFGKSVSKLTLSESALLAGLLKAPSYYSPISGDFEMALQRRNTVLSEMADNHYITQSEELRAQSEQINLHPNKIFLTNKAPHFAQVVFDELLKTYKEEDIERSGFTVKTTLDLSLQEKAESIVATQVKALKGDRVQNGALVSLDSKTGEILTLVGSSDWDNPLFGQVNIATAKRQPGSSFKPIVYATAFENNILTPTTILKDEPTTFKIDPNCRQENCLYKPLDYDKRFRGNVTVRRALANSLNIPAVEAIQRTGVENVVDMAHQMGVSSVTYQGYYNLSLALGSQEVSLLEMAGAYSTFANEGKFNPPTSILSITNKRDEVVYTYTPTPKQIIRPEVAFLISSILSDNIARAEEFGNVLTINRPAAVKTGTTENYRDALTIGYTPQITTAVWVGNNDDTPMDNIAGSLGAAPIWKQFMEASLVGKPVVAFTPPESLTAMYVCRGSGLLLKESTSSGYTEYFVKGTEPKRPCYTNVATNKPATTSAVTPATTSAVTPIVQKE